MARSSTVTRRTARPGWNRPETRPPRRTPPTWTRPARISATRRRPARPTTASPSRHLRAEVDLAGDDPAAQAAAHDHLLKTLRTIEPVNRVRRSDGRLTALEDAWFRSVRLDAEIGRARAERRRPGSDAAGLRRQLDEFW